MNSFKKGAAVLALALAASGLATGADVKKPQPVAKPNADTTAQLAKDAYVFSRQIVAEAQRDVNHAMSQMELIAKYDKLVWSGQHVGLLNGNYALVAHNAVPMMVAACSEAVSAQDNSDAQKMHLNNCFGGIRTLAEFNIANVNADKFNELWSRKIQQDLNAAPAPKKQSVPERKFGV